jgi:Ca2+/H+ antiporter
VLLHVFRYLLYLLFQLKTHSSFFSEEAEGGSPPALSLVAALLTLAGITIVVAVCSECAPLTLGTHLDEMHTRPRHCLAATSLKCTRGGCMDMHSKLYLHNVTDVDL